MLLAMNPGDTDPPDTIDPRNWMYHYDPETGRISFPPGYEDGYRWFRKHLSPFGVDIDKIETEDELDRALDAHSYGIMALIDARILNDQSPSLETQVMQALIRKDFAEFDRLLDLLKKRNELGIKVVKR